MIIQSSAKIELPSMPIILSRIINISRDSDANTQGLADAVMIDQALTSRILRLANSAYFNRKHEVETVSDAVAVLGFDVVRNLAASASVLEALFPRRVYPGFNWQAMWLHSVTCAIAAEEMYVYKDGSDKRMQETVFIAGLLHDIGKLVLALMLPLRFMAVVEGCRKRGDDMFAVENDFLSTNHAAIGYYVAEQWSFPEVLIQAIGYHHTPECASEYADIVQAVCAGDMLAKRISTPCIAEQTRNIPLSEIADMAEISHHSMGFIMDRVQTGLKRSDEILSWGKNLPDASGQTP